jgi:hypothetical protein
MGTDIAKPKSALEAVKAELNASRRAFSFRLE